MPVKTWPTSEKELAAPLVEWLKGQGYEVFQEVERYQRTADIVTRKDGLVWVIETKRSLSLEVIAQARYWRSWAHRVSVAVPRTKHRRGYRNESNGHALALDVLTTLGLGLLEIVPPSFGNGVTVALTPVLNTKASGVWRLVEAQKDFCQAGSPSGRWTDFKQTCINLKSYAAENPGCTLNQAIDSIKHHYRSKYTARARLLKLLAQGVTPDLRVEQSGKVVRLFSTENTV